MVASLKGFEYPFEVVGLADMDAPETVEDRDPGQPSDRWDRCHRSCLHEHHIPVLNTTSGLGQQSSFTRRGKGGGGSACQVVRYESDMAMAKGSISE